MMLKVIFYNYLKRRKSYLPQEFSIFQILLEMKLFLKILSVNYKIPFDSNNIFLLLLKHA